MKEKREIKADSQVLKFIVGLQFARQTHKMGVERERERNADNLDSHESG